jgi:hypothetical protein
VFLIGHQSRSPFCHLRLLWGKIGKRALCSWASWEPRCHLSLCGTRAWQGRAGARPELSLAGHRAVLRTSRPEPTFLREGSGPFLPGPAALEGLQDRHCQEGSRFMGSRLHSLPLLESPRLSARPPPPHPDSAVSHLLPQACILHLIFTVVQNTVPPKPVGPAPCKDRVVTRSDGRPCLWS